MYTSRYIKNSNLIRGVLCPIFADSGAEFYRGIQLYHLTMHTSLRILTRFS